MFEKNSFFVQSHKGEYKVDFVEDGPDALLKNFPKTGAHLIIDERIASLYKERINSILERGAVLTIEAIEGNKSLERMSDYVNYLVKAQVRKDHVLVAVGGGIIQDITCFLAATLFRGLDWHFYPTTLLAQADSCIGSKSSINCGNTKNLLGTFTPPTQVIIGHNFLDTLEEEELRSGVGEMLKVHCIAGVSDFDEIAQNYSKLFTETKVMSHFIRRSLEIKKKYIEVDEFDQGPRNIFNYGHTFGHAIEAATNFAIPHGIAVTIGLDMANWLSPKIAYGDEQHFNRMHKVLAENFQSFVSIDIPTKKFMESLAKDKKNLGKDEVTLILPNSDGKIEKGSYPINNSLVSLCHRYLTEIRFQ